jgi:hypothetical protein
MPYTVILEQVKAAAGSSSVIGAMTSGLLSLAATIGNSEATSNSALIVGGAAILGALFANLPKFIAARATARMNEVEFLGKTTNGIIERLTKSATDNERILAIEVEMRHTIQGAYQAAVSQCQLYEDMLEEKGVKLTRKLVPLDVVALLRNFDKEVINIKNSNRP